MPNPIDLRRKATELQLAGRHRQAAQLCEQILEHSPTDAQSALKLGELRRKLHDLDGARVAFQLAAELFLKDGLHSKAAAAAQVAAQLSQTAAQEAEPHWWQRLLARRSSVG